MLAKFFKLELAYYVQHCANDIQELALHDFENDLISYRIDTT